MSALYPADTLAMVRAKVKDAGAKPPGVCARSAVIHDGFIWHWRAKSRRWVPVAEAPVQKPNMKDY